MTVVKFSDPTERTEANLGDTIVVERYSKSNNLPLYMTSTFCGVVALDEETESSKQKFVLLMKTTFTNGKEASEKIGPNYGVTGPVVPYGPGYVGFSKVYGLHHLEELPTPNALTVYEHVMTARDWTFFDFELDQLTKDAKKHAPRSSPAEGFEIPSVSKFDKVKPKRNSLGSPKETQFVAKKSKRDQQSIATTTKSHLLSSEYHFQTALREGDPVLEAVTMESVRFNNMKTYHKKKPSTTKVSREIIFLVKVFGCDGELRVKCDHQRGGFYTALMNAKTEYDQKPENEDQQMPDFSNEDNKSMACNQFGQLWRKLRNQVKDNFCGIKQHPHFSEIHTEIRLPTATARSSNVAKPRPKKVVPKDQNTGEAKAVARQVKIL
jgi:hypothetical protein